MIQVCLVDDHVLLRDALAETIDNFDECKVTGVASHGKELQQIVERGVIPNLVLLDLNMPEMDGYDTAEWLFTHHPEVRVLILTMYDSEVALIRLLQYGVRGFLRKDIHPFELRAAISAVMKDGYYYSHRTTGKLATLFQKSYQENLSVERVMLSDMDIQFLRLVSTDMTYKEIAGKLNISVRSVDGYRDSLFDRLEVKSRVGLAIFALKNGLISV